MAAPEPGAATAAGVPGPAAGAPRAVRAAPSVARVSTLELFFDLVFVFTVTQLTQLITARSTWLSASRVVVMLWIIWWMYAGYAWLTNAVAPDTGYRRGLLLAGMAGFLVVALAVPHAFDAAGWAFGAGYLLVNLVHTALFLRGGAGAVRAMSRLGPLNLTSAGLVLAGGLLPVLWRLPAWLAAAAVQIASPYLHPIGGFHVSPAHFVERHGLVVIIALGESVAATGVALRAVPVGGELILIALSGLTLAFLMWWLYFGGDDTRAERALSAMADPLVRARAALRGFGYAHYPMLLGIVLAAAGVRTAIPHVSGSPGLPAAAATGGGVALFLAGDVWFRSTLRLGRSPSRLGAAVLALATVPVGLVAAAGQLVGLVAVLAVTAAVEIIAGRRARVTADGSTAGAIGGDPAEHACPATGTGDR